MTIEISCFILLSCREAPFCLSISLNLLKYFFYLMYIYVLFLYFSIKSPFYQMEIVLKQKICFIYIQITMNNMNFPFSSKKFEKLDWIYNVLSESATNFTFRLLTDSWASQSWWWWSRRWREVQSQITLSPVHCCLLSDLIWSLRHTWAKAHPSQVPTARSSVSASLLACVHSSSPNFIRPLSILMLVFSFKTISARIVFLSKCVLN